MNMIFHQLSTERGCQSYLIGCRDACVALIVDPELSLVDRYHALAVQEGLRLQYTLETHTHADHFSGSRELAAAHNLSIIMHRASTAVFGDIRVDDGESIILGNLRLTIIHTPGHTADSMCIVVEDCVLTGDTLLIGGTGRTDLPSGDPEQLYDSLFNKLLLLDQSLRVYPAHIYSDRDYSTIGEEIENNPRLQKTERSEFVEHMRALDIRMPDHLSEAIRTNISGGKTVDQLIHEAASSVSFMSMHEVKRRIDSGETDITILDVREKEAFTEGHIPGAILLPRGQLELRVNDVLPDPTHRIVVYCELGRVSTLAAATLKQMGFGRAVAMDGGMKLWRENDYPVTI
ncbi:MAG: rhodanese-like domain-containing protein [Pseudomonadales bacterium]